MVGIRCVNHTIPNGEKQRFSGQKRTVKSNNFTVLFSSFYTPSCSSAASFSAAQKISMAFSSSSTGGREGAMRMLLS